MSYDGLEPSELAVRLKAPSCLSLVRVTSTLDIIHELAAEGAPDGSLVLADEQVAGRGRFGKRWNSPPQAGIWLGYLVRPEARLEPGVLSLRVGLALVATLQDLGVATRLKWPNDVMLEGRKVAGVLSEARWLAARVQWIALGVGINVRGKLPPEIAAQAAALQDVKPDITRIEVLEQLVPRLQRVSRSPKMNGNERERYSRHDWLRGRRLRNPISGTAAGIDEDGALLVDTDHGVERVVGGSIVTQ
jgi:BirA family biotin operon repressor/biotin-[acetyl-CoA-carboxylase] ligase